MHGSKHRTTDTQIYETRKDGSGYSSIKRQWNLQTHEFNDETANHRKYMRTQLSADNRAVPSSLLSSQQQRQNGEKKSIKDTKKPLRVSGDWSEFKSSTGKTYFYNCKTEVSQWEKPKGWPSAESNRSSTSSISSTDRTKKVSGTNLIPTVRTRHTVDDSSSDQTLSQITSEYSNHHHPNGIHKQSDSLQSNGQPFFPSHNRLPSPGDDSSRMSFSSTSSSKESSSVVSGMNNGNVLHSSFSEPASIPSSSDDSSKTLENNPIPTNGNQLSGQISIKNSSYSGNDPKPSVNRSIIPSSTNTEFAPVAESEPVTPMISKAEREQELQKFYRADLIQHLTSWPATQLEKQCLKLFDDYYGYNAKMSTTFSELKALKSNFRILEIKRNILTQKLLRCAKHAKEREENQHF